MIFRRIQKSFICQILYLSDYNLSGKSLNTLLRVTKIDIKYGREVQIILKKTSLPFLFV